jgi:hypothetical protein
MLGLRWMLGIVAVLALGAFVALSAVAGGFRRSFGASERPVWMAALPIIVGTVIVASLVWPERRPLLHLTAAMVVALVIGCVVIARETVFVSSAGLLFAAGWLWFYYRALRP